MNNYLAMNICKAIMPIKDDSVNVTIVTNSGKVYNNVEVNDFDTKGVFFSNDKYAPYDDYEAWDTAETIEEARIKRSKLAMSFFSRVVVIVDENENEVE